MEENKTKQIHLRVSEEEEKILKEKAKNWGGSVSAFILNACMKYDSEDRRNKLQFIREWNKEMSEYKTDIDKIGTNINQIARVVNTMKLQGEVAISEDMVAEVRTYNLLMRKMERYIEKAVRGLLK